VESIESDGISLLADVLVVDGREVLPGAAFSLAAPRRGSVPAAVDFLGAAAGRFGAAVPAVAALLPPGLAGRFVRCRGCRVVLDARLLGCELLASISLCTRPRSEHC